MSKTILALYRGDDINTARLVGLSVDPQVVARFANELLATPYYAETESDPVLNDLASGRRKALHRIALSGGAK